MSIDSPNKVTFSQGIFEQSSTQKEILGSLRVTDDGRKFRYACAGAVNLAAGKLVMSAPAVANHVSCSVAAASIGDMSVTVTLGATAATLNQYKDGYMMVTDGTGEGLMYGIEGHPAALSGATCIVQLKEPIRVALAASGSSEVTLIYNPHDNVLVTSDAAEPVVGVPPIAVTAAYYFWCQTGGIAPVLGSDTTAVGIPVSPDGTDDGATATQAAGTAESTTFVGTVHYTACVDGEYTPIMLNID